MLTGWLDARGAIATVDRASSVVFLRCEIAGNGVPDGALVATAVVADFTPCTVIVADSVVGNNRGAFYGLEAPEYGILYADPALELTFVVASGPGMNSAFALPVGEYDPIASAPVLREEHSPLLAGFTAVDTDIEQVCRACT